MITEIKIFFHVDDIVCIVFILLPKSIEDGYFYQSLIMKPICKGGEKLHKLIIVEV